MDIAIEKKKFPVGRKGLVLIGVGLAVVLAVVAIATGNGASSMRVERRGLVVDSVRYGKFNDYIRIIGKVQPLNSVQLSPEEGGIVEVIYREEGARVNPGDPIIRLRNSTLDLEILNAEANLAEKQNFLRNTQVTMEQDKLNNRTEKLQLDIDVRQKNRAYDQYKRLYAEDLVSREEFLKAEEDYQLACEKRNLVSERLRQDSIYRNIQIAQLESDLENMRLSLAMIRERREKLTVCAPVGGELGLLDVERGQNVGSGQMVGRINVDGGNKIEADIDEHYIDRVETGLGGTFRRGSEDFTIRVRKVYPDVREQKFRVDFEFAGALPDNIRNGQSYYINLQLGAPVDGVLLPRGSFFTATGGNWVFVVDKDGKKAHRRAIRIARQNPQFYEVTEGLDPGEQVILSGYEKFGDCTELIFE